MRYFTEKRCTFISESHEGGGAEAPWSPKNDLRASGFAELQNGGRLGDVTEAGRPVLRGLEVIVQILRLEGHFCGHHGASAPPLSPHKFKKKTLIALIMSLTNMNWLSKLEVSCWNETSNWSRNITLFTQTILRKKTGGKNAKNTSKRQTPEMQTFDRE